MSYHLLCSFCIFVMMMGWKEIWMLSTITEVILGAFGESLGFFLDDTTTPTWFFYWNTASDRFHNRFLQALSFCNENVTFILYFFLCSPISCVSRGGSLAKIIFLFLVRKFSFKKEIITIQFFVTRLSIHFQYFITNK